MSNLPGLNFQLGISNNIGFFNKEIFKIITDKKYFELVNNLVKDYTNIKKKED